MSAEPLPSPSGPATRSRRAEGLSRSMLGRAGVGRPVLSLVATPDRAKRAPFVALILGILLAGLVGLLLLTTASAQDAFRLHRLDASASNTADTRQALSEQVNTLTGPSGLAGQAQKMGMVPMGAPEFWKPGTPLPPGARVVDGMVVVPANAGAKPAATAAPTAPAGSAGASVTAVPRPGQASTTGTASTTGSASTTTRPSTKASTSGGASTKPSTKATTKTGTATTGTTKTGTTKTGTTKTGTTRSGTAKTGTTKTGTTKSGTGTTGVAR